LLERAVVPDMNDLAQEAPIVRPGAPRYAVPMANAVRASRRKSGLSACPFCRELFADGEHSHCPECGVELADLTALPPSLEAEALIHEEAASATQAAHAPIATVKDTTIMPLGDMSRGRGVLMGCALFGFVLFFLPWAKQSMPEIVSYTGLDLAKVKGFFWSTLAAWMVMVPAVMSRRSVLKMIGARVAVVMLAMVPGIQCAFLLSRPIRRVVKGVPFEFSWGPAIYATIAVSVVATIAALGFGGKLEAMEDARRV